MALALLCFVSVAYAICEKTVHNAADITWAAYLGLILRCVIDGVLTAALCYYLTAKRAQGVKSSTNRIVKLVMVYVIRAYRPMFVSSEDSQPIRQNLAC